MNSAIVLIVLLSVFSMIMAILAVKKPKESVMEQKDMKKAKSFNNEVAKKITISSEEFNSDIEDYLDKLNSHEYQTIKIYQYSKEKSEVVVLGIDEYEELCKRYQEYKYSLETNKEDKLMNSLEKIHKKLDALEDNVLIIRDLK